MDEQKSKELAKEIKELHKRLVNEDYPAALTAEFLNKCAVFADMIKEFPEDSEKIKMLALDAKCEFDKAKKRREAQVYEQRFKIYGEAHDYGIIVDNIQHGVFARGWMFLHTPFTAEADIFLSQFAYSENNAVLREFDCRYLLETSEQEARRAYGVFANSYLVSGKKHILHVREVNVLKDAPEKLKILAEMLNEFSGTYKGRIDTIVTNTDPLFDAAEVFKDLADWKRAYKVNFAGQVLSMPSFSFVKEKLQLLKRRICACDITEDDEKDIKKFCYCIGYSGLFAALSGNFSDWNSAVGFLKAECKAKENTFKDFAKGLVNINGLIDRWEWNFRPPSGKVRVTEDDSPESFGISYEYDGESYRYSRDKVISIMNDDALNYFARIGKTVVYCFTFASFDDESYFSASPEEKSKRWRLAASALSSLLRVQEPELHFDLKEGDPYGLNVNGGEIIRLRKRFITDSKEQFEKRYVYTPLCETGNCSSCKRKAQCALGNDIDTLLHEFFHSVQHKAMAEDGIRLFYEKMLGIERHRVAMWRENHANDRYVTMNVNPILKYISEDRLSGEEVKDLLYYQYYNQVFEADARIFAAEVMRSYYSECTEIKADDIS